MSPLLCCRNMISCLIARVSNLVQQKPSAKYQVRGISNLLMISLLDLHIKRYLKCKSVPHYWHGLTVLGVGQGKKRAFRLNARSFVKNNPPLLSLLIAGAAPAGPA